MGKRFAASLIIDPDDSLRDLGGPEKDEKFV
jgi:hypothetical protein